MSQFKTRKILVVDDDEANRYATSWTLREAGFLVTEVESGAEALKLIKEMPDLVVLDVHLPDMSGFEVCRLVREAPETSSIPILHVSACYTTPTEKGLGLDLGADGYLIHPIEAPELIGTVNALLRAKDKELEAINAAKEWQTSFDAILDGVCLVDGAGQIKKANQAMTRLLGSLQKDLAGLCFANEMRRCMLNSEGLQSLLAKPQQQAQENPLVYANGRIFTVSNRLADHLETGNGSRVYCFNDITERLAAERILRETEERFRLLMENVREYALFTLDVEGRIIDWNIGAERITGYSEEEVVGKSFRMLYTIEDIANGVPEIELLRARETGSADDIRHHPRKDGSFFWATGVTTALRDDKGDLRAYSKVARDSTSAKRAEQDLRESELRFRQLAENINEVFWLSDLAEERMIYVSPVFESIWKLSREPLYKSWQALANSVHPDDKSMVQTLLEGNAKVLQEAEVKFRIIRPDGMIRWIRGRSFPIRDDKGQIYRIAGVAEDITESQAVQSELKRAKEIAEEANRAKSAFLANMSHEIRTPLGAVLGFSELLKEPGLKDEDRIDYIETINRNGRELGLLIDDILDLSKVEAGHVHIERLRLSLPNVLSDVVSSFSTKARDKGVRIRVETMGLVPETIVSDPTRLRQILFNIIGNAVKFTKQGEVKVMVEYERTEKDDASQLILTVKDTGRGISADEVSKLFKPFSQADASTTRQYGGTGLGLVLARKLAQALGGDVELLESALGSGSTFVVTLDAGPYSEKDFPHTAAFDFNESQSSPWESMCTLSGIKVLVAEDALDNQVLIRRLLTKFGAEVEIANNGAEALEKASLKDFSLILMDIQMPILDGYDATRELRSRGYKIPIIALTAHAMQGEKEKCMKAGCNDHLAKPIAQKKLIQLVAKYGTSKARIEEWLQQKPLSY